MSRIAQKLCEEIVEAPLTRSGEKDFRKPSVSLRKWNYQPQSPYCATSTGTHRDIKRSIVVEKKRVINKIVPNNILIPNRSKLKSSKTLLSQSFIDVGINTTVTGPLRCDNNCVTLVRQRDNPKYICQHSKAKHIDFKAIAKQIQTGENRMFGFSDKACAQCIETASCGTQFLENPGITLGTTNFANVGVMKFSGEHRHTVKQLYMREPDTRRRDFSPEDLSQTESIQTELNEAELRQAQMRLAEIRQAEIRQTDIRHAEIRQADLKQAEIKAELMQAEIRQAEMRQVLKKQAELRQAQKKQAELIQAETRQAQKKQAEPRPVELKQAEMIRADMRQAECRLAQKTHVDLKQAEFRQEESRKINVRQMVSKTYNKSPNLNYMGARRWALSQHTTGRGPDF